MMLLHGLASQQQFQLISPAAPLLAAAFEPQLLRPAIRREPQPARRIPRLPVPQIRIVLPAQL